MIYYQKQSYIYILGYVQGARQARKGAIELQSGQLNPIQLWNIVGKTSASRCSRIHFRRHWVSRQYHAETHDKDTPSDRNCVQGTLEHTLGNILALGLRRIDEGSCGG